MWDTIINHSYKAEVTFGLLFWFSNTRYIAHYSARTYGTSVRKAAMKTFIHHLEEIRTVPKKPSKGIQRAVSFVSSSSHLHGTLLLGDAKLFLLADTHLFLALQQCCHYHWPITGRKKPPSNRHPQQSWQICIDPSTFFWAHFWLPTTEKAEAMAQNWGRTTGLDEDQACHPMSICCDPPCGEASESWI
jgi:hypothetical protein